MPQLTAGELCAGYGGLGLAVETVFNARLAWFSEYEAAPSKILARHWPHIPNHGDMTKINWNAVEQVDILSGGTPCQDLSAAGRRRGMTEGTRSNLWVHMREAIATIQPRYVVWENVRGAYSATATSDLEFCPGCMGNPDDRKSALRALGRVLGDLSDLGYNCEWRGLRAADVGAPHGRFRIFILATRRDAAHPDSFGHERPRETRNRRIRPADGCKPAPHTKSIRRGIRHPQHIRTTRRKIDVPLHQSHGTTGTPGTPETNWGEYGPAIRRWEQTLGRRAPAPTEPTGRNGNHRLSARFTEWLMGLPNGWICDTPGITRNEQLKAAGNGVVPQQAAAALLDMLRP